MKGFLNNVKDSSKSTVDFTYKIDFCLEFELGFCCQAPS